MNPCIDALYTSHCPVLLEKILSSLSEFLSHLYSVTSLYLEFHYFNSPFKQKFNCKYIFQMHLVDLSKTHEQLVLSVSYTLMIKPVDQSQKMIPGQGISTIVGQGHAKSFQRVFMSHCQKREFQLKNHASGSI